MVEKHDFFYLKSWISTKKRDILTFLGQKNHFLIIKYFFTPRTNFFKTGFGIFAARNLGIDTKIMIFWWKKFSTGIVPFSFKYEKNVQKQIWRSKLELRLFFWLGMKTHFARNNFSFDGVWKHKKLLQGEETTWGNFFSKNDNLGVDS